MPEPSLTVTIDGHPYTLRPRELDAWQTSTFEAETGRRVENLISALDDPTSASLTGIAQFAYLCEIQNGTGTTFREVASRIRYGSDIERMKILGVPGVDDLDDDELADAEAATDPPLDGPDDEDPPSGLDGSPSAEPGSSNVAAETSETI